MKPRTKIVATLGPACDSRETLERMIRAGMSVARINMAHGTHAEHARFVAMVRAAARRAGRPVATMVDLAGPKIRVGNLSGGRLVLEPGHRVFLTVASTGEGPRRIPISEPRLIRDVRRGDPIFLADGTLELRALGVQGAEIACEVVVGGLLLPRKGVNLPHTRLRLPSLTTKDRADLAHALRLGVDVIALSFIRTPADVQRVRKLVGRRGTPLVAKIEKREAIENLDAILEVADGVMVARGDLGVETSMEEVPLLQKQIIRAANEVGRPVITATQMLLSMVESARPTRAEAADVANAILDGTDAVMLSEETARGRHPARVVETMARLAIRAEGALVPNALPQGAPRFSGIAHAVSEAAVQVAHHVGAKAIVTPTMLGATPRFVARLRPSMPVVALSERRQTVQFLCLAWGVLPVHVPRLGPFESALRVAEQQLHRLGIANARDRYVVTAGYPAGQSSNLMAVQIYPPKTPRKAGR